MSQVQIETPTGSQAKVDTHNVSGTAHADIRALIGSGGSSLTPTAVKTTTYTAAANELVPCDSTSGGFTVALLTAPADKTQVLIKHVIQGGTNAITVACGGSDVFNKVGGTTSFTLPLLGQAVWLQYKASAAIWYILADDLALSQLDLRFQPLDSDLTTIAALTATTDNFMVAAGSAWASRTPAQARTSLALGTTVTKTGAYTLVSSDTVVLADATSAGFTLTLPTAVGFTSTYVISAIATNTNLVTVATTSAQTINGASTTTLGSPSSGAPWQSVTLVSDGANWRIV